MEILFSQPDPTNHTEFKIDLIVWKLHHSKGGLNCYIKFKIDLIVWKSNIAVFPDIVKHRV